MSLAFGLTVLGCAYGLGHVSGCHLNPAVTLWLCAAKRFSWKDAPGYIVAQVLGAIAAARVLLAVLQSVPGGYDVATKGLAANGFGEHSPGGFGFGAAALMEFILTFIFLTVILGATSKRAVAGFAGIPIGLTLTLVHLVGILATNLSVELLLAAPALPSASAAGRFRSCGFSGLPRDRGPALKRGATRELAARRRRRP